MTNWLRYAILIGPKVFKTMDLHEPWNLFPRGSWLRRLTREKKNKNKNKNVKSYQISERFSKFN